MESQEQHPVQELSNQKTARPKATRRIFILLLGGSLFIALVIFGKRVLASLSLPKPAKIPTPTNLVFPTSQPLQLDIQPLLTPTRDVVPPTSTPAAPLALLVSELNDYAHPEGLFEIAPVTALPEFTAFLAEDPHRISPWQIVEENTDSVVLVNSKQSITFTVQVVCTGYELDQTSLLRFIDAREKRPGRRYTVTEEISQNPSTGVAVITVLQHTPADPDAIRGVIAYRQFGDLVGITELSFYNSQNSANLQSIDIFLNAVKFHPEKAVDKTAYSQVYEVSNPLGHIHMEVPQEWNAEVLSGEFTRVASYYSPDLHAVIQLITYDDGEFISGAAAGNFALFLLNSYLSTNIMVTVDRMLPDGFEQLEWRSPRYDFNYKGISSFHSTGTTFVMLTVMYDVDYASFYLPVLARAQASFSISTQAAEPEEQ